MTTRPRRGLLAALLTPLLIVPLVTVGPSTAAWAAGTLGLSQQLSFSGSAGLAFDVPSGSGLVLALTYSCGDQDCLDATIVVPIPAGLAIGGIELVSGASSSVIGNTVTITLPATLTSGSAGQIAISLTVPAWTTADGASFSWQAAMHATDSVDVTSNAVSITSRAESTTAATISLSSGGTIDEPVSYTTQLCVDPAPGASAVAVAAGSIAAVTLPEGASFVSAQPGGSHSAGVISWTLSQLTGCVQLRYSVVYDSSNPANVAGATKSSSAIWQGNFLGVAGTILLGTAVHDHDLEAPTVVVGFNKWSFQSSAAITTDVTWFLSMSNSGNTTADEVTIEDTIPDPMRVTSMSASMPTVGSVPGEVWISSRLGPDGVSGGGDDDTLVKAADLPVDGSSVGITIYGSGTWPSGAAQLPVDDLVQRIVVLFFDVGPGQGGDRVAITATVMGEAFDGTETEVGDIVTNSAEYGYRVISGSLDETGTDTKSHSFTVAPQITTISTSLSGGGVLPSAVRDFSSTVGVNASPFPLRDPVIVLLLPETVSLQSWTPSSTTVLPTPTLTTVPEWDGTGSTLYRWSYPLGTVLAPGTGYSIAYELELDEQAWGESWVRAYASSASDPHYCGSNWFDSSADTADKDGDGDTGEVLCNWSFTVSPAPSTSAVLTVEVDSVFSGGYTTGTVYSTPGGDDGYRLSMRNTGTLPLREVVLVATLPRPGDSAIVTSAARNATSRTFPVMLTGAATAPSLASPVTVWYTTETVPCLPELSVAAAGCTAAGWTTTLPSDPWTVTAVKVDFGTNILTPFTTWAVDLPVTTPTSGAAEADYAEINTDPGAPENDERASGSAAFAALTEASTTLTAESASVTLRMPTIDGGPGVPPTVPDLASSGVGTTLHHVTVPIPSGGEAMLFDGTSEVTSLTVPGEGSYLIDPATGQLSFHPLLGFTGTATAIDIVVRNSFGASTTVSYAATVLPPPGPVAVDVFSTAVSGSRLQTTTLAIPTSGSARLLDGSGNPVLSLLVAGEGAYTLDPTSGTVVFTPESGFVGIPRGVAYRLTDAYGQSDDAEYLPGAVPAVQSPAGTPGAGPGGAPGAGPAGTPGALPVSGGAPGTGIAIAMLLAGAGTAMLLIGRDRRRAGFPGRSQSVTRAAPCR